MRVLVTGAGGFVGTWLLRHLAEIDDDVVGLDAEVDITDRDAFTTAVSAIRPDAICHLAAQASVGRSWSDPATTWSVNTIGVVNLLDAALTLTKSPRVLLVSSAEVYGSVGADELPLREDHPFRPVNPYAASKAAAEICGLQAWLGRGLWVVRARPFNHTGPGQPADFVVPSLARQIAEAARSGAQSLSVGNLSARRDLTDVRDVVVAYRLLLDHGQPGEAYNVCRGSSTLIEDVARELMGIAGISLPLVIDPARMRPVDIPELVGDPHRLEKVTGWRPRITLRTTLTDVLSSFVDVPLVARAP